MRQGKKFPEVTETEAKYSLDSSADCRNENSEGEDIFLGSYSDNQKSPPSVLEAEC